MDARFDGLASLGYGDVAGSLENLGLSEQRLRFAIADLALRYLAPADLDHLEYASLAAGLRAMAEVTDEAACGAEAVAARYKEIVPSLLP